ncbi:hypothetical protein HMPREF0758_2255 [Serratia odorifera DSM 4582]|uniref:Uncharacterized protein n=1 Tax=Serratia odorifera DSM 4582 TaxID=667129 RepID=D4E255_SEROD|nr:hypothetical protein HMPREF0758_2255 [Serratia odorifera DSM 4582]
MPAPGQVNRLCHFAAARPALLSSRLRLGWPIPTPHFLAYPQIALQEQHQKRRHRGCNALRLFNAACKDVY